MNTKSIYNIVKTSVSTIFKPYISNKIPESQTNVFYMLFSGIDNTFSHLENLIRSHKRERNILTAQHISSLRTIAAANGFEPVLKVPAKGLVEMTIQQKLFNRVGFPVYIPPYANFKNIATGVNYYYDSNVAMKVRNNTVVIPLVEGELTSFTHQSTGDELERIYLESTSIADGSISITVKNKKYKHVKSFIDNSNEQNMFVVKFSERPSTPIVIYVKGTEQNDIIEIVYRSTYGESGNIEYETTFTPDTLISSTGQTLTINDSDVEIRNISGFNLGSNGTDKNTLKASVGFNHGINLLFDTVSYTNFLNKYSTLMLQDIKLENPLHKSINTIYIGKRNHLTDVDDVVITQYQSTITEQKYLLTLDEKRTLESLIEENEFTLSSHVLKDIQTTKYALQITFNSTTDVERYSNKLNNEIYKAFAIFLNDKSYVLNLELLFNNFMNDNGVLFNYDIFNSDIEQDKIVNNTEQTIVIKSTETDATSKHNELVTSFIIKHDGKLPILKGDFPIKTENTSVNLFFDINTVIKV